MSKICPECHKEYESGKFCPECGTKLVDAKVALFCPCCQIIVSSGKFCPECGSKLIEKTIPDEESPSKMSVLIPISDIVCPTCGFSNDGGASICAACGSPLQQEEQIQDNALKSDEADNDGIDSESILSKYRDEDGDMRDLIDEEWDNAFKEISEVARTGNPEAQYFLANCYLSPKLNNPDIAYDLLLKAEKSGFQLASAFLGLFYVNGIKVKQDLDEAIRRLSMAQNHSSARSILGDIYLDFLGDIDKARECYEYAAGKDYSGGYFGLGRLYKEGIGVPQDYAKAYEYFNLAVVRGSAEAEYEIGFMYLNGLGTGQDYDKAMIWFTEASGHGHIPAYNTMAYMYLNGEGVEQDKEKAYELFKESASQGNYEAMTELGKYYQLLRDDKKAYEWMKKAADLGYPEALWTLGDWYQFGLGVEINNQEAEKYHQKAREAGYNPPSAKPQLDIPPLEDAKASIEIKDYETAIVILKELAKNGDPEAQYELAKCYQDGTGVKKNPSVAALWLNKSANSGFVKAFYAIGKRYELGIDIAPNQQQALKWYRKAADKGFADAQFRLGLMYDEGRGVTQSSKKAEELICLAAENGSKDAIDFVNALKDNPFVFIDKVKMEKDIRYGLDYLGLRIHVGFEIHNMENKKFNCSINFLHDRYPNPAPVRVSHTDPANLNVKGALVVGREATAPTNDAICDDWFFEVPYYILCNHDSKGTWPIIARIIFWDMSGKKPQELKILDKRFSVTYSKRLFGNSSYEVVFGK